MRINTEIEEEYNRHMQNLCQLSRCFREVYNGKVFERGERLGQVCDLIKSGHIIKALSDRMKNRADGRHLIKAIRPFSRPHAEKQPANYFSNAYIAVYTCIFGKYDMPLEPISTPDNIDYYIITDQDVSPDSKWKKIDIGKYSKILDGMSNVEKNRWFKMHPNEVFQTYRYSIYVDGNVQIITDLTEFINRIGAYGISMFWHKYNNCVYQEAAFNKYSVKKISSEEIDRQVKYLQSQGMPEDFGMTTCNVIVRDHQSEVCKQLMDIWWNEFMNHCKRDQLSFPYAVWKAGLAMEKIATLGDDVWECDAILVRRHL